MLYTVDPSAGKRGRIAERLVTKYPGLRDSTGKDYVSDHKYSNHYKLFYMFG